MSNLALQINGQWAVLGQDQSVTIEENSPVWGEGNTFSLPFELDVEANRHIIGNADGITGMSVYDVLDGKPAVLYVMGIPLFYGQISLEDEVDIAEGIIDISLISSTLAFNDLIDGMNCQEVELKDRIPVGTGVSGWEKYDELEQQTYHWEGMPEDLMAMSIDGVSTVNVSKPYPAAKYCNARIMYAKPDKETVSGANEFYGEARERGIKRYEVEKYAKYIVLDADRPMSGLCFFVLYFLECLFAKLGIQADLSEINSGGDTNNDMNRLAFFSTRFSCDSIETGNLMEYNDIKKFEPTFVGPASWGMKFDEVEYVANSGSFPNDDVSKVIESLAKGFGVRFIYNPSLKRMRCVYVRDLLKNNNVADLGGVEILDIYKRENAIRGFQIRYAADEKDMAFNYSDWNNIEVVSSYDEIKKAVAPYNKKLYISSKTGNAYRIKVNEEAKQVSELQPVLMKVAQFNAVEYGDCTNESRVEKIEIPFSPIIQNDSSPEEETPTYAAFVNESLLYPSMKTEVIINGENSFQSFNYSYYSAQRPASESSNTYEYITKNSLPQEVEYAFQANNSGLTLGIMRGPGSGAALKSYEENYDGEGNFKYMTVAANYAFHADTIDENGGEFDYNGSEEGGTGTESEDKGANRFSLYLRAEKPKPGGGFIPITQKSAQKRGLFDKFYTEYAYFVTHRKIAIFTLRMEIADLVNIDWTMRYRIGPYVGFVNRYSYSVDADGISEVELEMYYL